VVFQISANCWQIITRSHVMIDGCCNMRCEKCGKQHTFRLESNSQNGLCRKFCPCHLVQGKHKIHLVKIQRVINYVSFFISRFKWCAQDYRKENQLWYKEAEEVPPSSKHSILLVA
jgi:hypothetical protein